MPNAPTPKRDVYLYVDTANMPPELQPGGQTPSGGAITPQRGAGGPPTLAAVATRAVTGSTCSCSPSDYYHPCTCADEIEEANRIYDLTAYERNKAVAPTAIIRGYYDTGSRLTVNGKQRPILASMVSFGYFVDHQGPVVGWKNALTGAEQITPDFYVIRVANNSAAPIGVRVEALEHPTGAGGPSLAQILEWLQWILIILILASVLFLFVRQHHHHP
jgi:hypothetical protein